MTAPISAPSALLVTGLAISAACGGRAIQTGDPAPSNPAPLHFRLLIAPGGDPASIYLDVERAERLEIDAAGNLLIRAGGRIVHHPRPRAYQDVHGVRHHIGARFEFAPNGDLRVALDAYDRTRPLTIAPLF